MSNFNALQAGSVIQLSPDVQIPTQALAEMERKADGGISVRFRESTAPIAEIHFGQNTDYARSSAQLKELASFLGDEQNLGVAHQALAMQTANEDKAPKDAGDLTAALLQAAAANENKDLAAVVEQPAEAPTHTAHSGGKNWAGNIVARRDEPKDAGVRSV